MISCPIPEAVFDIRHLILFSMDSTVYPQILKYVFLYCYFCYKTSFWYNQSSFYIHRNRKKNGLQKPCAFTCLWQRSDNLFCMLIYQLFKCFPLWCPQHQHPPSTQPTLFYPLRKRSTTASIPSRIWLQTRSPLKTVPLLSISCRRWSDTSVMCDSIKPYNSKKLAKKQHHGDAWICLLNCPLIVGKYTKAEKYTEILRLRL